MFDELEVAEDCYGIGHTSKLLAAELVNISSARMKKVKMIKIKYLSRKIRFLEQDVRLLPYTA